jgi:hypothetical protein
MTLGIAAAAGVRLIVWCKSCQHQVEPDPAEMPARHGADRIRHVPILLRSKMISILLNRAARRSSRD